MTAPDTIWLAPAWAETFLKPEKVTVEVEYTRASLAHSADVITGAALGLAAEVCANFRNSREATPKQRMACLHLFGQILALRSQDIEAGNR